MNYRGQSSTKVNHCTLKEHNILMRSFLYTLVSGTLFSFQKPTVYLGKKKNLLLSPIYSMHGLRTYEM